MSHLRSVPSYSHSICYLFTSRKTYSRQRPTLKLLSSLQLLSCIQNNWTCSGASQVDWRWGAEDWAALVNMWAQARAYNGVWGLEVRGEAPWSWWHCWSTHFCAFLLLVMVADLTEPKRVEWTEASIIIAPVFIKCTLSLHKMIWYDTVWYKWVSEQCFTSPPTQYRLYGRRFLQVIRPNQQYQSTEGRSTKYKQNNGNN